MKAPPPPPPSTKSGVLRLQDEVLELREEVAQLTILNEVATSISTAKDLNQVLSQLVEMTVANMNAEQGAIWLFRDDEANPLQTLIRKLDGYGAVPMRLRPSLAGWVSKHQQTLVVDDLATDPRFTGISQHTEGIRSVLAAPLKSKDKLIGVMALFNKKDGKFSRADQRLATILGAQSAQTIENVQLTEQERQQEALQRDLKLASDVQQQLLPKHNPEWPGYEVFGRNVPAREVGGDSFEFLDLGAGRVALAIADVSGKGVAAALLMASLHATLRCLSTTPGTIADRVSRINRMVCESTATGRFATLFYAELDLAERVLRYTNAGHNFPVLLRPGGAVERLETGGVPVGLMVDWKFEEAEVRLSPGDVLLLYSDGVSEAENPRNDQFGEDAVEVVLKSLAHLPCEEIVQSMLRAVSRFAAGAPQTDDQTLVALRVLPD